MYQSPLLVGQSSLMGEFTCQWCREPYAQYGRFAIPTANDTRTDIVWNLSFCLPECAAAHNAYQSTNPASMECHSRHQLIEKRYGRPIHPAPTKRELVIQKLERVNWLPQTRRDLNLNPPSLEIAEKELWVQTLVLQGIEEK